MQWCFDFDFGGGAIGGKGQACIDCTNRDGLEFDVTSYIAIKQARPYKSARKIPLIIIL